MRKNKGEKVEIELELESGFICDFDPDFELTVNSTAIEKVRWKLQDGTHSGTLATLLSESEDERCTPTYIFSDM